MTRTGAWVTETAVEEMTTETVPITKVEVAAVEVEPASNAMKKATLHENARTLTNSMTVVVEAEVEEEEAVAVVAVSATSATKKVTLPENVQMIQMVAVIAWIEVLTSDRGETRRVAPQMATGQVMVVATGTRTRVEIRQTVGANETE